MKNNYHLKCLATDGEMVTEGRDFDSVSQAWERANEMGSRWIFYPVRVVTTEGGFIRGVPEGCPIDWMGRNIKTLCKSFAGNEDAVCDYVRGYSPLLLLPQ
jgi:hypothetical protein